MATGTVKFFNTQKGFGFIEPSDVLEGLDGDAAARAVIEEQDRIIAEKSGTPAVGVKSIHRSGSKNIDRTIRPSRRELASD